MQRSRLPCQNLKAGSFDNNFIGLYTIDNVDFLCNNVYSNEMDIITLEKLSSS